MACPLENQIQAYTDGLQRYLVLAGMIATPIDTDDPSQDADYDDDVADEGDE